MRETAFCGTLRLSGSAILCPVCRQKIRGVRVPPDGVLRGVELRCANCKNVITVHIDQTSAYYSGQRH